MQREACDWMFQLKLSHIKNIFDFVTSSVGAEGDQPAEPWRVRSLYLTEHVTWQTHTHQVRKSLTIRYMINRKYIHDDKSLPCQSSVTVVVMNCMEKWTRLSLERSPWNFSGLCGFKFRTCSSSSLYCFSSHWSTINKEINRPVLLWIWTDWGSCWCLYSCRGGCCLHSSPLRSGSLRPSLWQIPSTERQRC